MKTLGWYALVGLATLGCAMAIAFNWTFWSFEVNGIDKAVLNVVHIFAAIGLLVAAFGVAADIQSGERVLWKFLHSVKTYGGAICILSLALVFAVAAGFVFFGGVDLNNAINVTGLGILPILLITVYTLCAAAFGVWSTARWVYGAARLRSGSNPR